MLNILEKEENIMEVGALVDPKIVRVSMVKNPANRETFTYRRSATNEGENVKPTVIHKIITQKGTTLQDVMRSAPETVTWLQGIPEQSSATGEGHQVFCAKPEDQFVPGSFDMQMISRGSTPAWVVTGVLKDDADKNDVIAIPENSIQRANIPASPKDLMNGYSGTLTQAQILGDKFYSEWWSFQDVMHGLLNQSAIPMKQRKAAIAASLDGFKAFLMMLLDSMDDGTTQRSAEFIQAVEPVTGVIKQTLEFMRSSAGNNADSTMGTAKTIINRTASVVQKTLSGGKTMGFQFETREDFDKAIASTVATTLRSMQTEAEEKAEAKRKAQESADALAARDAEIKRMADQIATLEAKIAGTPATQVTATETVEQQRSAETIINQAQPKPADDVSVFNGFLEGMIG